MKVFIVGSRGYIGRYLTKELTEKKIEIVEISSEDTKLTLNLNSPQKFQYSHLTKEDYIVFTAAISSPDICAENFQMAYQINVTGTKFFIREALNRGSKVIFFSSDAVFGFSESRVNENSLTVNDSLYGSMKKEIEDEFILYENFKAVRLSYVFSESDKYSMYLKKCAQNKNEAEIFHPFYRNCVTLPDVMLTIHWLIINWKIYTYSFLNICGSELISRIRIADEWKRWILINLEYSIVTPPGDFFNNRPPILEMESLYLGKIINEINIPFSEKVRKMLQKENVII